MRIDRRIAALATAATLAASSTPAYAFETDAPAAGNTHVASLAQPHPAGSTDWTLELAAGGAIALIGTGLVVSRQRRPASRDRTPDAARSS